MKKNEVYKESLPKKYRDAVRDFWEDEDGWWITLKEDSGYIFKGYFSDYTIHEDTKAGAVMAFRAYIKAKEGKEK